MKLGHVFETQKSAEDYWVLVIQLDSFCHPTQISQYREAGEMLFGRPEDGATMTRSESTCESEVAISCHQ